MFLIMLITLLFLFGVNADYTFVFPTVNTTLGSGFCKDDGDLRSSSVTIKQHTNVRLKDYDYVMNYNVNVIIDLHFANTTYVQGGVIIATIIDNTLFDTVNNESSKLVFTSGVYYSYTNNGILQELITLQATVYVTQFGVIDDCPHSTDWYVVRIACPILGAMLLCCLCYNFYDTDCSPRMKVKVYNKSDSSSIHAVTF